MKTSTDLPKDIGMHISETVYVIQAKSMYIYDTSFKYMLECLWTFPSTLQLNCPKQFLEHAIR